MLARYDITKVDYATFKAEATSRSALTILYVDKTTRTPPDGYELYLLSGTYGIRAYILDAADVADFEANHKFFAKGVADVQAALAVAAGTPQQVDLVPEVAVKPSLGKELIDCTHNMTDSTTRFYTSERVEDRELAYDGSEGWYESGDVFIDLIHGKVFDEHTLCENHADHYAIVVKVGGVEKTQRAPWAASGGDYEVDYAAGKVRPFTEDWSGSTVTASYNRAVNSEWKLVPYEGKCIQVNKAEVQFSEDLIYASGVRMEIWGLADYFAPGMFPPGTKIPIGKGLYNTVDQFIDEAVGSFPPVEPVGGAARGIMKRRFIFHFYYGVSRQIFSSLGMEILVRTIDDVDFGGERCTATFYCTVKKDPGPIEALKELTAGS